MSDYVCQQCGETFDEPIKHEHIFSQTLGKERDGTFTRTIKFEEVKVSPCCEEDYEYG